FVQVRRLARLRYRLKRAGREAARGPGIAPRPIAGQHDWDRGEKHRTPQQSRALANTTPITVRKELAHGLTARTRVIHRDAPARRHPLESGAAGSGGDPAPRERETSARRAVARTQPPPPVAAEPFG